MSNLLTLRTSEKSFQWNLDAIAESDWRQLIGELEYVYARHVKGVNISLDSEPLFVVIHNPRAQFSDEEEYMNYEYDYEAALADGAVSVEDAHNFLALMGAETPDTEEPVADLRYLDDAMLRKLRGEP